MTRLLPSPKIIFECPLSRDTHCEDSIKLRELYSCCMPFWGRTFNADCRGIRVNGWQHLSDNCIDRPIVWRRGRGGAYKSLCTWRTFQDENLTYAAIELKGDWVLSGKGKGYILMLTLFQGGGLGSLWSVPPSHTTTTSSYSSCVLGMNWGGTRTHSKDVSNLIQRRCTVTMRRWILIFIILIWCGNM